MQENRYQTLSFEQVTRLHGVLKDELPLNSRNNFPTIKLVLKDFVIAIQRKLEAEGLPVSELRINGSAASFILGTEQTPADGFNDLDVIFKVSLASHRDFEKIRSAVLNCLMDFLPEEVERGKLNTCILKEAYVEKMFKVWNNSDRWSLISLGHVACGDKNIELKFVNQMVREYQFSVDSFQIMVDSMLSFLSSHDTMSHYHYPTVVAESVYGNFSEAYSHLQDRLIATCGPEMIRGGGLLRYCDLLERGYTLPQHHEKLEQYMSSRFFIDFSDLGEQQRQMEHYLQYHFSPETGFRRYQYLLAVHDVIRRSTICLMRHERSLTLNLVLALAQWQYSQTYSGTLTPSSSSSGSLSPPPPLPTACHATVPPGEENVLKLLQLYLVMQRARHEAAANLTPRHVPFPVNFSTTCPRPDPNEAEWDRLEEIGDQLYWDQMEQEQPPHESRAEEQFSTVDENELEQLALMQLLIDAAT